MEALLALIGKTDNIALLVLIVVAAGFGYRDFVRGREDRADRLRGYEVIEANTRAIESLRLAISLQQGKPV